MNAVLYPSVLWPSVVIAAAVCDDSGTDADWRGLTAAFDPRPPWSEAGPLGRKSRRSQGRLRRRQHQIVHGPAEVPHRACREDGHAEQPPVGSAECEDSPSLKGRRLVRRRAAL